MTDRSHANANGTAPRTTADTDRNVGIDSDDDVAGNVERDADIELLHVEPDPRAAEVVAAFIDWGFDDVTVRSVGRLDDALEVVADVDCVVTEHRLPDGTGVELVERARERDVRTPFVFHTTCHDSLVESNAIGAGADAYVRKRSKRTQYDRLLESIRSHARATGSEDTPSRDSHGHGPEGPSEPAPMPLTSEE